MLQRRSAGIEQGSTASAKRRVFGEFRRRGVLLEKASIRSTNAAAGDRSHRDDKRRSYGDHGEHRDRLLTRGIGRLRRIKGVAQLVASSALCG